MASFDRKYNIDMDFLLAYVFKELDEDAIDFFGHPRCA